jgi:hypothetical protein
MMEPRDWYVVLNMLRVLKGGIEYKLEKYWECRQRYISDPQNLLFIRHDPRGEIFDLNRWLRLKPIIYVV